MSADLDERVALFTPQERAAIERAMVERRSIRAFLPTPVPRETIEHILEVAARAPSGTNMQPWRAHVLVGADRDRRDRQGPRDQVGRRRAAADQGHRPVAGEEDHCQDWIATAEMLFWGEPSTSLSE